MHAILREKNVRVMNRENRNHPAAQNMPGGIHCPESAEIYVRNEGVSRSVAVSDAGKPFVSEEKKEEWRNDLDFLVGALNVSAALLMCITPESIRVLVGSRNAANPFSEGETFPLGQGMLCENVLGVNAGFLVENAPQTELWRDDLSVRRGMRDYYGVPLHWKDGAFFGTLCVFDRGSRLSGRLVQQVIHRFGTSFEKDLELLRLRQDADEHSGDNAEAMSAMFRYAPGGIFSYSAEEDEQFSFLSTNMLDWLGYTKAEFINKYENRFSRMVWQEDRERVLAEIDEQIRHGSFDTCEYRIEKKDGSLVWVHDEGHIVTDENGKRWFYVVIVDITPSIDTQKKLLLRNSELETTVRGLKETIERGSGTGDPEAIRARELLRQRQREEVFRIITNVEYDYVALLHADSSRIEFWNLSQKLPQKYRDRLGEPGRQYDFDDIRRFTADSWVDPADREMYLKSSPIPAVREALDRFGHCEFSLRGHTIEHPEQTMCRKIQHYYLGDDHDTILILQTDVTKTYLQQQTNVELARTEARRVRDILDYIASGVCVLVMPDETHLNIEYSNRQMPRLLRFSEDVQTPAQIGESTDGKVVSYFESAFSGVHPEDLPRVQEAFRAGFRLEQFTVPSFRLRTGTGGYIWVTVDIVLREIRPDGHVFYGTYRDISAEVELRAALERQRKKQLGQTLLETINRLPSSSILFRVLEDKTLRVEQYSDEFCRLGGYRRADRELRSDPCARVHSEDRARVRDAILANLDGKEPFHLVYRIAMKSGAYKWVSVSFSTIEFNGVRYLYAQYTDIDQLKKQEQQLEEQYNAAQAFLDSVSNSYLATRRANLTRNTIEAVAGTNPILQVTAQESYDAALAELFKTMPKESDREKYSSMLSRTALLRAWEAGIRTRVCEYQYRENGGEVRWVRTAVNLTKRPGGGDIILFSAVQDISQEKLLEAVMSQVIAEQYDFICCIDASRGRISMFLPNDEFPERKMVLTGQKFDSAMRAYHAKYSLPAERESCDQIMSLENVLKLLEGQNRCVFTHTVVENGAYRSKQAEFFYIDRESAQLALIRTDYTEAQKKQLEQEERLRAALNEAQKANRAKSEFLSRMSHDMRTPLNGIIGMTYLTQTMELPAKVRENLGKIDTSSKFLLNLINDVLDMSKAESERIELHPEPYAPKEFTDYIDAVVRPLCEEKNLHFEMEARPPETRVPLFDKLRINQIVFNLLSNAVKYTPEGGTVRYCSHFGDVREDGTIPVCIEVSDNGIGMSEEFQKILFEPFSQEERPDAPKVRGSGLGLSIAQKMVSLMGGTIQVQSGIGKGTTFTVRLTVGSVPLPTEPLQGDTPAGTDNPERLAGRHILLCEDHPLNQEIARTLLMEKQMLVEVAENGQRGVELFSRSMVGYFDAVLMDIRMPVMNGYEAVEAIRALPRPDAKTVPILAMTADAFADDVQKCLDAGMNGHIAKPIDPEQLYGALRAAFSGKKE